VEGRGRSKPLGLDRARDAASFITAQGLEEMQPKPLIVDVGTQRNYREKHVPGAKWIPYGWLEMRIGQHASSSGTKIVLTCPRGVHSVFAAANLRRSGFTDVLVLEGGVNEWEKHFSVESGADSEVEADRDVVVQPYHGSLDDMAEYLEWERNLTRSLSRAIKAGLA